MSYIYQEGPLNLASPAERLLPGGNFTLSWHNLSVWVKKKDELKSTFFRQKYNDVRILNKVSGIAEPGTLVAIMGPSGAGKTTLLATISQRFTGSVSGNILVNGKDVSTKLMLKLSGFVPQHDLTIKSLTVLEHMQLMARLKMDTRLHATNRNRRISTLITDLGLANCCHTRLSALSGGENKRVSLAVEMLTDPPLLFCDEPTTGLDSYNAGMVIEKLRQLALRGKTVICSIHQPASGVYDLFHSVILMAPGGELAYQGDPKQSFQYFSSLDLICPDSYNLAEFVVTQLAVTSDPKSQAHVSWLCAQFQVSAEGQEYINRLKKVQDINTLPEDKQGKFSQAVEDEEFLKYKSIQKPNMATQLYWLVWRSFVVIFRNPQQQLIRISFYMFIALLISTPYTGLTIDQKGIQNMQGCLYLVIVETIFTFSYSVYYTFPSEIPILLREIGNGLYSPGPYYISKMIILFPQAFLEPILYSALVFWIAGLFGEIAGFIQFCVPVIVCAITATAYGCFISAVFDSVETGTLVAVPIEQIGLMFCGIFMSLSDTPIYYTWIKYVSMFYYGIEALSILQWTQVDRIPCSEIPNVPCISTGEEVLSNYGYSKNNYKMDLMGLLTIYCVAHIFAFLAFKKRSKIQAAY